MLLNNILSHISVFTGGPKTLTLCKCFHFAETTQAGKNIYQQGPVMN